MIRRENVSFEQWLDETFGRAVIGLHYPRFAPSHDPASPVTDELSVQYLTLDVMEAVLRLDNPACKEAALHGLGHMTGRGGRALAIIDKFLDVAADQSAGLAQYARAARTGCIQ